MKFKVQELINGRWTDIQGPTDLEFATDDCARRSMFYASQFRVWPA